MIVFKAGISRNYFHYFEAVVGLMLIALATFRLIKLLSGKKLLIHKHEHGENKDKHTHSLAYGVGLVHGFAGSGALVLLVMSQMKGTVDGLLYLIIFGLGCIAGMFLAAGLFGIPFSKKILQAKKLQIFLIIASSLLCLLYGGKVIYENLEL